MRTTDPSHPQDHPVNWSYSRFVDEATEEQRDGSDRYYWLSKQDAAWQTFSLLIQLSLPCPGQYLWVGNLTCSFPLSHACELTLSAGAFCPLPASSSGLMLFRCRRSSSDCWLQGKQELFAFLGVILFLQLCCLLFKINDLAITLPPKNKTEEEARSINRRLSVCINYLFQYDRSSLTRSILKQWTFFISISFWGSGIQESLSWGVWLRISS